MRLKQIRSVQWKTSGKTWTQFHQAILSLENSDMFTQQGRVMKERGTMLDGFNGKLFRIFESYYFCFAVAIFDLLRDFETIFEPRHEKTNILVSDLVRHKQGCTAT